MVYVQRKSGIFIRQNMIPQADLQAETVFPEGQYIEPGIHQVLSYMTGRNASGPRMLQTDVSGNLMTLSAGGVETLGVSTQVNLIPSRTDVASFTSADFLSPAFTVAIFTIRITAVSGTTPNLAAIILSKSSDGSYTSNAGGGSIGSLGTVGTLSATITAANAATFGLLSPLYHILVTITGTTPSFTWLMDMVYK